MTPAELEYIGVIIPPTEDELPFDDGVPMETQRHKFQMDLLLDALYPWFEAREDGYANGNMFVYYSLDQVKNRDFRGPDFFAALGVSKRERKSWVCWIEGKTPDVVIELLSESTCETDKGVKKQIYQNQLHVPEYFWYDPFNPNDWAGFQLQGSVYQPISINAQGLMICQMLDLALVRWQGSYRGVEATWLRWASQDGVLLPTEAELAEQAQQQVEQAQQQAEQAQQQVAQIIRNLVQSGMSIAQVSQVTGLTVEQVQAISLNIPNSTN
jgi:Uma2 family endonuclease